MSEATFRTKFLKDVKDLSPDIIIEFADPQRRNGIPDVIIFYKKKFARIETKRSKNASKRLHQQYYIDYFNSQGIYAAFLTPENKEEVFNALRRYFKI
jgi:hypothetical protein